MTIPFLRFLKTFKKDPTEEGAVAVAPRPVAIEKKSPGESLGKTFIPNSARIVGLEEIPIFSPPSQGLSPVQTTPAPISKISLGGSGAIAVGPKIPAGAPDVDRTITFSFADLLSSLPKELLKPDQSNRERPIVLKAAEVERGMATGRPAVLLRAIYSQVPEFFNSEVPSTDLREVALPFNKVVEQFASFQVRDDQVAGPQCPQLETPFLQVTIEDNERFGLPGKISVVGKTPAVIAGAKPEVAATAPPPAQAAAPVVAAAGPKPKDPIRFSMPAPASAPVATAKATAVVDQSSKVAATSATAPQPTALVQPSAPVRVSVPAPVPVVKMPAPLDQPLKIAPAAAATAAAKLDTQAPPLPPAPASSSAPASAPAPTAKVAVPPKQPPRVSAPTNALVAGVSAPPVRSPSSPPPAAKISPNGTGAPAAESVPASSGSPVPTPLPSPFAPLPPTRIPFKVPPPSNDVSESPKFPAAVASAHVGLRIALPLRNILRNVAPFQLSGPIDTVPDTARIEIPFSIVQPQLSSGRVAISPEQFQAALPEEYRALFIADPAGTPVPLLLQDVLQNLPGESLQLRGDQEEPEMAAGFETPFSQKADEDAARMKVPSGPIAKSTAATPQPAAASTESAAQSTAALADSTPISPQAVSKAAVTLAKKALVAPLTTPAKPAKKAPKSVSQINVPSVTTPAPGAPGAAVPAIRNALQSALDTDEPLDAKSIVAHVSRLPGVRACAIVFSDGLSLAGNIPEDLGTDALCAMAPSIIKRIDEQMRGARLGALGSLSLVYAKMQVSLFAHDGICLVSIHSDAEITAEVRDCLGHTTQELARMYSQQPNA